MEKEGKTLWYFEHVPSYMQCFEHTVRRWENIKTSVNFLIKHIFPRYYPVANLTRTRQAVIIEPLRPEKFFVKTFNATSLYILSICEVCGSYQCPYCPFYSSTSQIEPSFIFITFSVLTYFLVSVDVFRPFNVKPSDWYWLLKCN